MDYSTYYFLQLRIKPNRFTWVNVSELLFTRFENKLTPHFTPNWFFSTFGGFNVVNTSLFSKDSASISHTFVVLKFWVYLHLPPLPWKNHFHWSLSANLKASFKMLTTNTKVIISELARRGHFGVVYPIHFIFRHGRILDLYRSQQNSIWLQA